MYDIELQQKIESGIPAISKDEKSYGIVFSALKKEPGIRLSPGFADSVLQKLSSQSTRTEIIWLAAGILSFIIAGGYSVYVTEFNFDFGVFTFLSGYRGLVLFAVAFLVAINWVDKRFLKKTA